MEDDEDLDTNGFCEMCDEEVSREDLEDGVCGGCRYHVENMELHSEYRASVL